MFARSRWERLVAQIVPLLTGWTASAAESAESTVVDRLTLWERFLVHRPREQRQMTFSVALRNRSVIPRTYAPLALSTILTQIVACRGQWENQPLDVEVGCCRRPVLLDPRDQVRTQIGVAVIDDQGCTRYCKIDPAALTRLSDSDQILSLQARLARATQEPHRVSIVVDERPQLAECFNGTYAEFPGAWLRVAPDAVTGGLLMTADHLVLDGALFQDLLLRTAVHCCTTGAAAPFTVPHSPGVPVRHSRHISFPRTQTLCATLRQVISSLELQGMRLSQGHENILLATIPTQSGNEPSLYAHHRRRILPLLLNLQNLDCCDDMRQRIAQLNERGTHSLSAVLWERLYSGQLPDWVIHYFEKLALRIPLQRTARYLSGSALLSCLPPASVPGLCASEISHLAAHTMTPPAGGPTITMMQVPDRQSAQPHVYLTVTGSGRWNHPGRLERLQQSIAEQLSLEPTGHILPPPVQSPTRIKQPA
ncbi:MAG: hypothetical protein KDA58_09315 [Planctomycetaceae bacterium]|nr:hypothetical protein [Planctomycetaceae bacterium]